MARREEDAYPKVWNRRATKPAGMDRALRSISYFGTTTYLLSLVRFIHQNPVRARLVERAEEWAYSSALAYSGKGWPFVSTAEVVALAGDAEAYARLSDAKQPKIERELFTPGKRGLPALLGDLALVQWRPMRRGPWNRRPPPEAIEAAAERSALRLGWDMRLLADRDARRELQDARRDMAAQLRRSGYRLHQIANVLGRQEAAISRLMQRAKHRREPKWSGRTRGHSSAEIAASLEIMGSSCPAAAPLAAVLTSFRRPVRSSCRAAKQSFVPRKSAFSLAKASFRGPKD
jgi:hypothetical protein